MFSLHWKNPNLHIWSLYIKSLYDYRCTWSVLTISFLQWYYKPIVCISAITLHKGMTADLLPFAVSAWPGWAALDQSGSRQHCSTAHMSSPVNPDPPEYKQNMKEKMWPLKANQHISRDERVCFSPPTCSPRCSVPPIQQTYSSSSPLHNRPESFWSGLYKRPDTHHTAPVCTTTHTTASTHAFGLKQQTAEIELNLTANADTNYTTLTTWP